LAGVSGFSGSRLDIFNVESGEHFNGIWRAHSEAPNFIDFLDDGERIVTTGDDGTIRFWNAASGEPLMEVIPDPDDGENPFMWIRGSKLSPDRRLLATSVHDGTVRVWDTSSGSERFRLAGHNHGGHRALQFSPDGLRLASWGDDLNVFIWDMTTGKAITEYHIKIPGIDENDPNAMELLSAQIGAACFSSDTTKLILPWTPSGLVVLDAANGKELSTIKLDPPSFPKIKPYVDGKSLMILQSGPSVQTPLEDGKTRRSPPRTYLLSRISFPEGTVMQRVELPGRQIDFALSNEGGFVAVVDERDEAFTIRVLSMVDFREVEKIRVLESKPQTLAFALDNSSIVCSMESGNLLVWDLKNTAEGSK